MDISYKIFRDPEEDARGRKKIDKWLFIILLLSLSIVPLIVGVHIQEFTSPVITDSRSYASGQQGDVYTYYKYLIMMTTTAVALFLLVYKTMFLDYKIRATKLNYWLLIMAIAVMISMFFSPFKSLSLFGMYNRHDGAISYICYLLLFFVAININYPKKTLAYIVYATYPFIVINAILALMNFFDKDVLQFETINKLLSIGLKEGVSLSEGSMMLGTLNHGNYLSGASAILLMITLTYAVLEQSNIRKATNFIMALLSFATMLASLSTSGFLTILVFIPVLIFLIIKMEKKTIAAGTLVLFLGLSTPLLVMMSIHNPKVWDESVGIVLGKNPFSQGAAAPQAMDIDFSNLLVSHASAAEKNDFKLPELPESGVGPGSGRLYIWEKAFELIMKRPITGYGLDTFVYAFPQEDPGKHANIETYKVVVDKPHSMYIGVLYGTGILGFIGFMGIVIYTLWHVLKTVMKPLRDGQDQLKLVAIGLGATAFLFQAIFNDSIVGLSIIGWVLMGVFVGYLLNKEGQTE